MSSILYNTRYFWNEVIITTYKYKYLVMISKVDTTDSEFWNFTYLFDYDSRQYV